MAQPVERLEKTLARVAKEQGVAQERLRRRVFFSPLCGVLERAVSEGILDSYDLKGGALELRFAEGARATKYIGLVCRSNGQRDCGHFRMPLRWASMSSPFS
ncbi:hypothetical protein HDF16_005230 [Granulicella aggregans]|uniref:Uncharacterized protein n=1 Tax=Granulicella aggregans TaxID=474949 RepID=A0A7W7ZJ45_9BACT|nr:hypothetical protein [Granulicella aggregans]MBB5060494.1 hypothetical protein [Granulicella aggregans]